MRWLRYVGGGLGALVVLVIHWTCRIRFHDDPRPRLRAAGQRYVYAFLHAQQIATVVAGEPGTGAMVSRSTDGDLLVPSLRVRGIVPIRGSTSRRGREKGGRDALEAMIEHCRCGRPAYFAVDGPLGPRGHVRRGIAELARETGAHILVATAIPSRRWILAKTWDRFQVPRPFSRIDVIFGDPVRPEQSANIEDLRDRVAEALRELETRYDPDEAAHDPPADDAARSSDLRRVSGE